MTYELWDLVSRNLIDGFEDREIALQAVQAYLDADEANEVTLIVRDASGEIMMAPTGAELIAWATHLSAAS